MLRRVLVAGCWLLVAGFFTLPKPISAIYDPFSVPNNRFGIHILDTSELSKAAEFVNSSGGDWGYITIPIQANDRNLPKWTKFMLEAKTKHIIPILRIASFPVDDHWMAPNEYDLVDFANFLDELPWPTRNRYVVIYNEPNHKNEWGGFVYPEEYARVLERAVDIFHKRNPDFFVISAGFDSSAPDGPDSMNEYDYLRIMNAAIPGIFSNVDGFASHAYGNPGFASFPNIYSRVNIANYRFEENFLSIFGTSVKNLFLTEVGWRNDMVGDAGASSFYRQAFLTIWTDINIVAVTPFLLSSRSGPFDGFSFTDQNGNFKPFASDLQALPKTKGSPNLSVGQTPTGRAVSPTAKTLPERENQINAVWKLFRQVRGLLNL